MIGRLSVDQMVFRVAVVGASIVAVLATRQVGDPVVALEAAIICLAVLSAGFAGSHYGLLLVLFIGLHWVMAVERTATPLLLVVAGCVTVIHAALAAATSAPVSAGWTLPMRATWARRTAGAVAASVIVWTLARLAEHSTVGTSSFLVAIALLAIAIGVTWAASCVASGSSEPSP